MPTRASLYVLPPKLSLK